MLVRRSFGEGGRALALCAALLLAHAPGARAQGGPPAPLPLLDVPFISQSEALCGGAAAAMVLRYWGERGVSADSFSHLLDRSAAGIRTGALVADLQRRGVSATGLAGREDVVRAELSRGRPVIALIEDRPRTFHYVVVVAWHDRGIVFHDPARAPFRVMGKAEFDRRWGAADRWMAIVLPASARLPEATRLLPSDTGSTCDRLIAEGVRSAQTNDLDAAERSLTAALECPGSSAVRELAGVRLLQKRWPEVTDLASTAVAEDGQDTYAWKLLATGRFVQDDRLGALDAWNRVGEPRLDLLRVDGLARTRQRVVERLLSLDTGTVLTASSFARAGRRLAELPAASSTRLEYIPVPAGLAELRGVVVERPLMPADRMAWAALGLSAAAMRELRFTTGSFTGGGEQVSASWRFWPQRSRVAAALRAPAPWGGLWGIEASREEQGFTSGSVPSARRAGAQLTVSDWASGRLRWNLAAGLDRWEGISTFGRLGGGVRFLALDDRLDTRVAAGAWTTDAAFATIHASLHARSSVRQRGVVWLAAGTVERATNTTPLDLWSAGDTGHARATLLRAHPVLDGGRLRVDRLGRSLVHASFEAQRWWRAAGPLSVAAAVFADAARTSRLLDGLAHNGIDAGFGARVAVAGMPGIVRVDLARGLRDGATALSFVYEP